MKEITNLMINEYKIKELGYDFMGFSPAKDLYTAHHLIIPRRCGGKLEPGNVSILMSTSHNLLHKIEAYNRNIFTAITYEMIEEVRKGKLDEENIFEIYYQLDKFYKRYKGYYTKHGNPLIRKEYRERLVLREKQNSNK
jgi:hypothetical protein